MPVGFRILPRRGLVLVSFSGFITIDEIRDAAAGYIADPAYVPGQKKLVDLSQVTGHDIDPVAFMQQQASKAQRLALEGVQSFVVYYAPTPIGQQISAMFVRTWDGVNTVVPIVQQDEAQALDLMGQPERSIEALMAMTR